MIPERIEIRIVVDPVHVRIAEFETALEIVKSLVHFSRGTVEAARHVQNRDIVGGEFQGLVEPLDATLVFAKLTEVARVSPGCSLR